MTKKYTTKKLPVSIGKSGEPTKGSEFIIPSLSTHAKNVFIGLKSGKEYELGCISYIGKEIDEENVISKLEKEPLNLKDSKRIINEYLEQLQNYKIGNVVSIQYNDNGSFILKKEANRPPSQSKSKLP